MTKILNFTDCRFTRHWNILLWSIWIIELNAAVAWGLRLCLWCVKPLSTKFQLFRVGQFLLVEETGVNGHGIVQQSNLNSVFENLKFLWSGSKDHYVISVIISFCMSGMCKNTWVYNTCWLPLGAFNVWLGGSSICILIRTCNDIFSMLPVGWRLVGISGSTSLAYIETFNTISSKV